MLPPLPSGSWLERQRNIIDFSVRSLLQKRIKNTLILVIFMLLVFVMASVLFITSSLTTELFSTSDELPDITVQKIQGGRQVNIQAAYSPVISKIPGVESVEFRVWGYFYLEALKTNFTIYGLDINQLEEGEFQRIVDWKLPSKTKEQDPQFRMIIGRGVHRLMKEIRMSESFLFFQPDWDTAIPFDIVGIFDTSTQLQSNDLMVLQMEGARKVLAVPDEEYTDLIVHVPNPEEVENIALKIRRYYPELRTITKSQIQTTYASMFSWRSGFVLSSLLVVILAFLVLIWDKASGLSPLEKREIGILKAIGWDTDMVLTVKLWENLILSLLACITGILLSYAFVYWLKAPGLKEIFIGWSTIYPDFQLVPSIDFRLLLLILCFTVVPYVAFAILPAWKAAITDPDNAIRDLG